VVPEIPRLSDVLEMLYTARSRYRTVRLEAVVRRRPRLEREAVERMQSRGGGQRVLFSVGPEGEIPERQDVRLRLAGEPPSRWRLEREEESGTSLTVVEGERWWMYHPAMGALTNAGDPGHQAGGPAEAEPLLDPSPLLATHELEIVGSTNEGIEVLARRRPDARGWDGLSLGADEHRLVVHPERGILLRITSLFEGEELGSVELERVELDVELPAETFVFEPPEGVLVRDARDRGPLRLTIEEAAQRASFVVFVLTGLEGEWRAHAMYVTPEEGQEAVQLSYLRADAFRHIQITESGTATGWAALGPVSWQECGDFRFLETDGQTVVAFEREGTHLQLTSNELSADELIALAERVEKAEGPAG
jgi:outer membrane lipoprotein-sorting protein